MKNLIITMILFASIVSSLNAQTEKQDTIKTDVKTKEFVDPIYSTPIPNPKKKSSISPDGIKTPGDYLIQSARLKLTGIGLGFTASTLFAVGAFDEMSTSNQEVIAILSVTTSLGLFIIGELTLIKAGKLMNEERVTLSPASEGIGLSINF